MLRPFRFKRFSVSHQRSAMKVGTDGVLLGAWCGVRATDRYALDIGTGTGLIALMLAQRGESNPLFIDAVEIDPASADEAEENAVASTWADRINVMRCSLQEFVSGDSLFPDRQQVTSGQSPAISTVIADEYRTHRPVTSRLYDLIVSNPPFFSGSLHSPDVARTMARHSVSLSYEELVGAAARLLSDDGRFCVIVPYEHHADFLSLSIGYGFSAERITSVIPKPGALPKRSLLQLSKGDIRSVSHRDELLIELGGRHEYSREYKMLTSDFYLKF